MSAIKDEIRNQALQIVENERRQWEDAVVFVTPTVGFNMRKLIQNVRKNFWGVFDKPIDPNTGREKVWMPMTMRDVEIVWKSSDLDLKDMMFRAKYQDSYPFTEITRHVVSDYLTNIYFGETLDESMRQMILDGTVVWKTWEENKKMKRKTVDLLNIYINPTEDNIQSAYRFTERSLQTPEAIASMDWLDNKDISGSENLDINNSRGAMNRTTAKLVDVWEMWGMIPEFLITGKKKDTQEVEGHIIVSGLESGGKRVHLIERNTKKDKMGNTIKPYEEGRLAKITGRWYGLGIPEREIALQELMNTSANIRINRQYIAQLGLFKLRTGSGITPQALSNLSVNGIIPVSNMEDIQQMPMQEPGASAYNDEALIKEWAQAVTQAYPIASGESLPASQTATTSAIQSGASKSSFNMIKNAMSFFLTRWMDRHALPIIAKSVKKGDMVRIIGGPDGFKNISESIVAHYAEQLLGNDKSLTPEMIQKAMADAEEELKKRPTLFVELMENIIADGLESYFYTNNEALDTAVTVQNLIATLNMAPQYQEAIVGQVFDLMGLQRPKIQSAQPSQGTPPNAPNTLQALTQGAHGIGQGNSAAVTQG